MVANVQAFIPEPEFLSIDSLLRPVDYFSPRRFQVKSPKQKKDKTGKRGSVRVSQSKASKIGPIQTSHRSSAPKFQTNSPYYDILHNSQTKIVQSENTK
jgi:hypothetical protein